VEILVALFVVVLITSLVSLNVGSGDQNIRLESLLRHLVGTANYALDEAQISGQDYGLLIEQVEEGGQKQFSYAWRVRALDGWQQPDDEDLFAQQALPPGITFELDIENSPFTEVDIDESEEGEENSKPQIVLYSSGEATVGTIDVVSLEEGELLWRIEWDLLGRFELLRNGLEEEELE